MTSEPVMTESQQSSTEVELFRTDDYIGAGRYPLEPLLRSFFEPLVGTSLEHSQLQLIFLRLADARDLDGTPAMVNLRASHGWVQVRIVRDGRLIYQHPHAVREIIAGPLQRLLRDQHPTEKHWGYGVKAPGLDRLALVRPAPQATHQVGISLDRPRRSRRFLVEEIPEPEPPTATLADLGVDTDLTDPGSPVGVVIDIQSFDGLTRNTPFSTEVEEGGFLAGEVYRAAGNSNAYLVKVTAAVPAERTGASMMHFTFTGESFLRIGQRLDSSEGDLQLIGWYHTHLFPATESLGLSSVDVELHTSTFRKPSQIAGLVNLDGSTRVLRFYRSDGTAMHPAPYWVASR